MRPRPVSRRGVFVQEREGLVEVCGLRAPAPQEAAKQERGEGRDLKLWRLDAIALSKVIQAMQRRPDHMRALARISWLERAHVGGFDERLGAHHDDRSDGLVDLRGLIVGQEGDVRREKCVHQAMSGGRRGCVHEVLVERHQHKIQRAHGVCVGRVACALESGLQIGSVGRDSLLLKRDHDRFFAREIPINRAHGRVYPAREQRDRQPVDAELEDDLHRFVEQLSGALFPSFITFSHLNSISWRARWSRSSFRRLRPSAGKTGRCRFRHRG